MFSQLDCDGSLFPQLPVTPITPRSSSRAAQRAQTASEVLALFSPRRTLSRREPISTGGTTQAAAAKITSESQQDQALPVKDLYPSPLATPNINRFSQHPNDDLTSSELSELDSEMLETLASNDHRESTPCPAPRVPSSGMTLRRRFNVSYKPPWQKPKRPAGSGKPREPSMASLKSAVRKEYETIARSKEDRFFRQHKDFFLPLLPSHNHIARLSIQAADIDNLIAAPYLALTRQPDGITAQLKPYQLTGLSFLVHLYNNGTSGILGDEMGLGKTIQTLDLLQHIEENFADDEDNSTISRCYLVVCPLSVLSSWTSEAGRFAPALKVLQFHGTVLERSTLKEIVKEQDEKPYKLVVTTYETYMAEHAWFKSAFVFRVVILDEGHCIKTESTKIASALQGLRVETRLILSGTPFQNDLQEFWALLHWLYPNVFTVKTAELFKEAFDLSRGQVDTDVMNASRHLLELICMRRMKDDPAVDLQLPPKEEILLFVPLTPLQRSYYTKMISGCGDGVLEKIFQSASTQEARVKDDMGTDDDNAGLVNLAEPANGSELQPNMVEPENAGQITVFNETRSWSQLMNLLMQLRKTCTHPYLAPGEDQQAHPFGEASITASGKFIILRKTLEELVVQRQKKIIIFSGFLEVLGLVEDLIRYMNRNEGLFKYARIDGSAPRARRNLSIRQFSTIENYKVMLMTTRAGSLGLNLTVATEVIFLDEDWNPQVTLQAEARAHRIGQTEPVTIYKLCTQGTVEEQMLRRIKKKLYLSAKVTADMKSVHLTPQKHESSGNTTNESSVTAMNTRDLISIIRRGIQISSHEALDSAEIMNWNFNTIVQRCSATADDDEHQITLDGASQDVAEQEWLSKTERVETAVLEGSRVQRNKESTPSHHILLSPGASRADRRHGKNTTVDVNGFAVSKWSLGCANGEATPTLAGKDPSLACRTRAKRAEVMNQDHCQVCWDGGMLVLCTHCPRSYHAPSEQDCLEEAYMAKARSAINFICPQHACCRCQKTAKDAGGLIYRCRWCPRGLCEHCLDWDKIKLVGEELIEFKMLGHGNEEHAYFIECDMCRNARENDAGIDEYFNRQQKTFETAYKTFLTNESKENEEDQELVGSPTGTESPKQSEDIQTRNTPSPVKEQKVLHLGIHSSAVDDTTLEEYAKSEAVTTTADTDIASAVEEPGSKRRRMDEEEHCAGSPSPTKVKL